MNFLLRGPMLDPEALAAGTNVPQSATLPDQVWLLRLAPGTLLHTGLILAIVLAVLVYIFLLAHHDRLPHSRRWPQPDRPPATPAFPCSATWR